MRGKKNGKREDSREKAREGTSETTGLRVVDGFFICVCVTESGER